MLNIIGLPALLDNYIWLLWDQTTRSAIIIDPGTAKPVLSALVYYEIQLIAILVTHHHRDHSGGIPELLQHFSVPIYGPKHPTMPFISHVVKGGETIFLKSSKTHFKVFATPGHTGDHLTYLTEPFIFTGDTLFTGGCGRLFEGTATTMWHSLQIFSFLPSHFSIYCGHEYTQKNLEFAYAVEPNNHDLALRIEKTNLLRKKNQPTVPSTLLVEQQTNPFLRTHLKSVWRSAEQYSQQKLSNPVDVFFTLRSWKDSFIY